MVAHPHRRRSGQRPHLADAIGASREKVCARFTGEHSTVTALDNIDLSIPRCRLLTLLGPELDPQVWTTGSGFLVESWAVPLF